MPGCSGEEGDFSGCKFGTVLEGIVCFGERVISRHANLSNSGLGCYVRCIFHKNLSFRTE